MFLRKIPRYLRLLSLITLLVSHLAGICPTSSFFTAGYSTDPICVTASWEPEPRESPGCRALPFPAAFTLVVYGENGMDRIDTPGGVLQMYAVADPPQALEGAVTWSVSGKAAQIDDCGLLIALTDGTVWVTATTGDGSGITGTLEVIITNQGDDEKPAEEQGAGGDGAFYDDGPGQDGGLAEEPGDGGEEGDTENSSDGGETGDDSAAGGSSTL